MEKKTNVFGKNTGEREREKERGWWKERKLKKQRRTTWGLWHVKLLSWLPCPPIAKTLMECKSPMMMMNGIGEDDEWESPITMNRVGEHEWKSAMMMNGNRRQWWMESMVTVMIMNGNRRWWWMEIGDDDDDESSSTEWSVATKLAGERRSSDF